MVPAIERRKQATDEPEQGSWSGAGWRGIQTGECGRSRVEEHVARSGVRTPVPRVSSAVVGFRVHILPAESDLFPIKRNEPVITNGNAMGIAAQIAKHRFWTRHRLFDINDPFFLTQRLHKGSECLGIFEWPGRAAETEFVPAIGTLESVEKLATEDLLQYTERKEKTIPRAYPTTV